MGKIKQTNPPSPLLAALYLVLALGSLVLAAFVGVGIYRVSHHSTDYYGAFWSDGTKRAEVGLIISAIVTACGFVAAALIALGWRWKLVVARWSFWPAYFTLCFYVYFVARVVDVIIDGRLPFGEGTMGPPAAFRMKLRFNFPAVVALLALAVIHFLISRRSSAAAYPQGGSPPPLPAQPAGAAPVTLGYAPAPVRISSRRNPAFGGTMWASVVTHALVILVVPWMLTFRSCSEEEYQMPGGGGGGGGQPKQQVMVKVAKKKQQPRKKKYLFRPNSAIYFHTPSLDDSKVLKEVDLVTENQLVVSKNIDGTGAGGEGFGAGGGKGGGWPGGAANAPIQFIRLQYTGDKWNDGYQDGSRADENFLQELHNVSKLKVQEPGVAIDINRLRNFKKGRQPPFIFMTGEGTITMPDPDIKVLRQYLMDGGMLFADCGSPQWHSEFVAWSHRLFPDKKLLDISNDDPIYHNVFDFPNGAPPLWHHGGTRSLGIKIDDRWAVFYFPGDMNDAWKTGHNGTDEPVWRESYKIGINVVKYAFDHYWAKNYAQPGKK